MPYHRRRRPGITRLEILIVLCIIAILGAIMVNVWQAAVQKARAGQEISLGLRSRKALVEVLGRE